MNVFDTHPEHLNAIEPYLLDSDFDSHFDELDQAFLERHLDQLAC